MAITNPKLEKRIAELEARIEASKNQIDSSLIGVKNEVGDTISPAKYIRRNPLPILGAAIIVGFIVGKTASRKSKKSSNSKSSSTKGISSALGAELKYRLTQKGISLLMNLLEDKISSFSNKAEPKDEV